MRWRLALRSPNGMHRPTTALQLDERISAALLAQGMFAVFGAFFFYLIASRIPPGQGRSRKGSKQLGATSMA